jgi:head-tail adaptor
VSFSSLLIHTVTIYSPTTGTADRYGNATVTLTAGETTAARVESVNEAETDDLSRDTRRTLFRVFLPLGTTVDSLSQIGYDGRMHRVDGEPRRVSDGKGEHHVELIMEKLDG